MLKLHSNASVRTISKWRRRYRAEGEQGLLDRCSAPGSVPARTAEGRVCVIAALRRLRMTGAEIAETLGMPLSTVSGILARIGLGKLWGLEPLEPPNRYEKQRPGELVHVDVKKLGRISGGAGHRATGDRRRQGSSDHSARTTGWEYVHVAIDDATRLVYVEVLADEKAVTPPATRTAMVLIPTTMLPAITPPARFRSAGRCGLTRGSRGSAAAVPVQPGLRPAG